MTYSADYLFEEDIELFHLLALICFLLAVMLLILAAPRVLMGLSAAPPYVAAPLPSVEDARPVEVLRLRILKFAVLAVH